MSHVHCSGVPLALARLQRLALIVASLIASPVTWAAPASNSLEIDSFDHLYSLSPDEAALGLPFKMRGVVLCVDPEWGQFYIHDGTAARYLDPRKFPELPKAGDRAEITGRTSLEQNQPALTSYAAVVLGSSELPQAEKLTLSQMDQEKGQWIEVEGTIRLAEASLGRVRFLLEDRGFKATAYIMGPPLQGGLKTFLDRRVRIRGINSSDFSDGRLTAAVMMVPNVEAVATLSEPRERPLPPSAIAIGNLLTRPLGSWTNSRVHINGIVSSYVPGKHLIVRDPTGIIRAESVQAEVLKPNDRVDLWGFLKVTESGPILDFAWFERMAPPPSGLSSIAPVPDGQELPTLTGIAAVSALTREDSSRGYPVRLRGTITYADPDWGNAFLQDAAGGVYFGLSRPDLRPGHFVELTGRTSPGGFSTEIVEASVEILGKTNLPPALKVDLAELTHGKMDADWVELEGLVQRIDQQWGHAYLTIMTPKGKFRALVPGLDDKKPPTHLIDALVRVRGACTTEISVHQQLVGFILQTPSLEQVTVIEPAPAEPFGGRSVPSNKIAAFDPERPAGRRVKVTGTITLVLPDIGFVLQDEWGGLRVNSAQSTPIAVGDVVEALGFPAIGEFSPLLDDSVFRAIGKAGLPSSKLTTAEEILSQGANDQQLVKLQGQLLKSVPRSARPEIVLQSGSIIFTVSTHGAAQAADYSSLRPGSLLEIAGVCSIEGTEHHEPKSFRVHLRQPADVAVLKAPPWWTDSRLQWISLSVLALALISAGWGAALSRKNRLLRRAQRELQKANDELEARVEERTRDLTIQINDRIKAEKELEKVYQQLITVSRQAGMAEVATGVLHNVGNVLNSVNISSNLLTERIRKSRAGNLQRICTVLQAQKDNLADFISNDPRGRQLPVLLEEMGSHLTIEQSENLKELDSLRASIDHIKDVVAMQQSYAKVCSVIESVKAAELMDDALRMNATSVLREGIHIIKEYEADISIRVEKHKVLQILVNLLQNAKHACEDSDRLVKEIVLRITADDRRVQFLVIDNGVGIPPENLTRIFSHGFTTRKNGHGFGLHNGALAARELGGALSVKSDGPATGATFILDLPIDGQEARP